MSVVPCEVNGELDKLAEEFAEILRTRAHTLWNRGGAEELYDSGVFRAAIEKVRGGFSATMTPKRDFVSRVLNHMEDGGFIDSWEETGGANRHDYLVTLNEGRIAAIELKGCLDGNNTNIFERPHNADEFVVWSVCTNPGSDPRHNVWSGIHTRLGAEMITKQERLDGLVVWDYLCGTIARPCPKMNRTPRWTQLGPHKLPPPCIYMFPSTVPAARNNPSPPPQPISSVGLLDAMHRCFGGFDDEVHNVQFDVSYRGADTVRKTTVKRGKLVAKQSKATAIRRR